jgi:hypothetical protein
MTNTILTLVVMVLAGAAAELAARWWIRHRTGYYVLLPGQRLRLRPDPDIFPRMETSVRFDVNDEGERGDCVPPTRHGLYRVLVAGGSQPEGYLLDQATFWPGRLQTLLRTRERLRALHATRVHVGSIAKSGVGAEGLNLIFTKVLDRYSRLNMIIILVGASDMLRWLEAGAPRTPPPVKTADTFRWHPESTFRWKPKQLALVEVLARLRQRWFGRVEFQDRACKWIGRARAMRTNAREILTSVSDPQPMLNHFDAQFREAIARAKAHADRVLIVRQPWFDRPCTPEEAALMWHGGTGQAWREQVTSFYSHDVLMKLMSQLDARASAAARELDVEQLDVRAVLEPGVATYYDFFHLTPVGAAQVAETIAAAVLRQSPAVDDEAAEDESDFERKVS